MHKCVLVILATLIILIVAFLLYSCEHKGTPSSTQDNGCLFSLEQSQTIAAEYINKMSMEWGEPDTSFSNDTLYFFHYPTPDYEIALLGTRGVTVNCKTGVATLIPRF